MINSQTMINDHGIQENNQPLQSILLQTTNQMNGLFQNHWGCTSATQVIQSCHADPSTIKKKSQPSNSNIDCNNSCNSDTFKESLSDELDTEFSNNKKEGLNTCPNTEIDQYKQPMTFFPNSKYLNLRGINGAHVWHELGSLPSPGLLF